MQAADESPVDLWKVVRWARKRAQGINSQATISTLKHEEIIARDLQSKTELF
jgi:hypothetical protein